MTQCDITQGDIMQAIKDFFRAIIETIQESQRLRAEAIVRNHHWAE